MSTHLWSFVERLSPRLISALVLFAVAAYTDPRQLGLYSAVTLCYTAIASVTDAPARQVLIHALRSPDGRRVIARYRVVSSIVGGVVVVCASTVLVVSYGLSPTHVLEFLPVAFVPAATAAGIPSVGRLQIAGRWKTLARGQMLAATVSLVATIPVLLVSHSVGAAALQALLTEVIFSAWAFWKSRPEKIPDLEVGSHVGREFRRMAMVGALGWSQAQADRVFIGIVGGPALLGVYSVASALARSVGDSLASATANILRARVMPEPREQVRDIADEILRRSVLIASGCSAVCAVGTLLVASRFLGPEWGDMIKIVPVLAVSSIPSSLTWSGSVLQVKRGGGWRAVVAPSVGVLFAPLIGLLAAQSLMTAATLVVVREIVVVVISFALAGGLAPWGPVRRAAVLCALGLVLVAAAAARV